MKKIIIISLLIISLCTITYAQNRIGSNEVLTTKLTKEKLIEYLNKSVVSKKPIHNKFLNSIYKNIQFDKLTVEWKDNNSKVVIIPLKTTAFSQHSIKNGVHALQYLLIGEDDDGKIEGKKVVFFFPKDKSLKAMPKNGFNSYFFQSNEQIDGTYIYAEFSDFKYFEADVESGRHVQIRSWDYKNNLTINADQNCRTWRLITTFIYKDKMPTEKIEVLGNTCTECPPGYICDTIKK